ncbi:unnamed protein product [Nippostrongylus brasiliensis]|uniref:Transposase n=1 Tax=Nippostrongylus brasiliensis TaxID=27835 RepID=A0A0N4XVL7_NIPBR|nr:unnamed protein product [Nippostrongylus brasiliensis]
MLGPRIGSAKVVCGRRLASWPSVSYATARRVMAASATHAMVTRRRPDGRRRSTARPDFQVINGSSPQVA